MQLTSLQIENFRKFDSPVRLCQSASPASTVQDAISLSVATFGRPTVVES